MGRSSRIFLVLILGTVLFSALVPEARAWDAEGHRWILSRAVELLNDEEEPFFRENADTILKRVMDPDKRKRRLPQEEACHYIDLETYLEKGLSPDGMPWKEEDVRKKMKAKEIEEAGRLPWAIEGAYRDLVRSLTFGERDSSVRAASDLAHYAGDAQQPLHTTTNYDGLETGNKGIHFRFEIELVSRFIEDVPPPEEGVPEIRDVPGYTFGMITDSHQHVRKILDSDSRAFWEPGLYDDNYYRRLWADLGPLVCGRLQRGAVALAAYYRLASLEARENRVSPEEKR